jgi:hypothetical protein
LTFLSDTTRVAIDVEPVTEGGMDRGWEWVWDLLVDGERRGRVRQDSASPRVEFQPLPNSDRLRRVEVYLPSQYLPVALRSLRIDAGARIEPWSDPRRRWVVYGSSITHAKEAAGPSETWPAIVARTCDLHLTNLGYGGQEHLEPMVARMIRDLAADYISLCVGGNVSGSATLSDRTYRAAVIGLVKTIRDTHPSTPIVVTSFIYCVNDREPNKLGFDMPFYRGQTREAVEALRRCGDEKLWFVDGPTLWGPADMHLAPDGVHPEAEGQHILARRYLAHVMPLLMGKKADV